MMLNSLVPASWSGLTADVGFQPEEIDAALGRTELRWRPMPDGKASIRFTLNQVDGCLRLDAWSGDAGLLPLALDRHLTAMTPRHYVICPAAPPDPADPAAWPPPLAVGAGRGPGGRIR